ncbi:CoA transferase [Streptomyces sp. NPDC058657]|uniref:CoA transferase n=1 Tax=unclassified Streptomyces TaxID=2593676 RepID=UPI0036525672
MTNSEGGGACDSGRGGECDAATAQAWAALGGPPELVAKVAYERDAGDVLPARLPVRQLARAAVGACSLAAAELVAARGAAGVPAVRISEGAVATAFHSERLLRIDGRAPANFAPLSGFWRTADSWVRTHANYPHHRARLLTALGIPDDGTRDGHALAGVLAAELATRTAHQVQEAVYAAGGLAVALAPAPARTPDPTSTLAPTSTPASVGSSGAAPVLPLVERRSGPAAGGRRLPQASLPAAGVRVLDLTRVLAGPVAARTLALLGADVLRVDPPGLREDADTHTDTGMGKRSTLLDLTAPHDRETFERLLASADVVLSGYRPGALDRLGLAPEALLERRPGLVVAQLCAWGWTGPWSARRGFDSLVQVGTGIASIEGEGPGGRPGALPAQALDHGTGYLVAAGVLRALTVRQESAQGCHLRYSLAGTASWLMHGLRADPRPGPGSGSGRGSGRGGYEAKRWMATAESPYGTLDHALPPVGYQGAPRNWSRSVSEWGTDRPEWL